MTDQLNRSIGNGLGASSRSMPITTSSVQREPGSRSARVHVDLSSSSSSDSSSSSSSSSRICGSDISRHRSSNHVSSSSAAKEANVAIATTRRSISFVPAHIVHDSIFVYLDPQSLANTCNIVCKRWRIMASGCRLWHCLCKLRWNIRTPMCRARVYGSNKWIQVYKSLSRRMRMPRGKYTGSRCRVFATGRHEGVDVWVSVVHRPDCSLRSTSSQILAPTLQAEWPTIRMRIAIQNITKHTVLLSTLPQDLKLFIRMKSGMIVKPVLHEHQQQQQQQHLPNERGNFSPPPLPGSSGAVIVHDASEQGQEEKKASSKRRSKRGIDHDLQQYVKEDDTISPRVVAIDGRKVQRYAGEKVSLGPLAFAVLEASFPAAVRGVRFEPEFLEQCDMMCLCGYKAAAAEGESDDTQFSGVNKHGRGTEEEDVVVSSRCEHEEGGNKHAVQLHCYQKQHGSGRNRQQTKWQRVTPRINFIDDGEIWY